MDEDTKGLLSLLPKIKVMTQKDSYLATLDDADRRRYLLREYFNKKSKRRPAFKLDRRFEWIVLTKPFPQLFEYKSGDEELFAAFYPIKFRLFRVAYEFYKNLVKAELKEIKSKSTAGWYKNPAKLKEPG